MCSFVCTAALLGEFITSLSYYSACELWLVNLNCRTAIYHLLELKVVLNLFPKWFAIYRLVFLTFITSKSLKLYFTWLVKGMYVYLSLCVPTQKQTFIDFVQSSAYQKSGARHCHMVYFALSWIETIK